jgi:hypothetical protein
VGECGTQLRSRLPVFACSACRKEWGDHPVLQTYRLFFLLFVLLSFVGSGWVPTT